MSNIRSSRINIRVNPEIKEKAEPILTENGYTPEFEAKVLAEMEELYAAVANGTVKAYKNAAELFADLDAEDDDDD
ncbi:MAG: hypothetical protein FWH10_09470 [Oscillospiraceae bacterium]|nr:hypothetical protein [Oscillospiraceae bacterium]